MTDLKNSSDINSNTIYMSALSEIKALLLKDIADNGLKSYHPSPNKLILKNGEVTKKAEKYNRRLLLEGKTTRVLDDTKIFNIDTGRFKNKPLDGRYTKKNRNPATRVYKQGAIAGKNRINDVFASKKEEKDFRYVMPTIDSLLDSKWDAEVAGTLRSHDLLRKIVKDNQIKGNYRIIITVNQQTVKDDVYNVKPTNVWWDSVESQFRYDSDNYYWNNQDPELGTVVEVGDVVHFIFTKEKKLVKKYYEQAYLDAKVGHCVFTPILDWAWDMVKNAKGTSTKKKYNAVINKIVGIKKDLTKKRCRKKEKVGYLDKYKNGIPQSEIAELCEDLQIGICIEQPFETNKPFFKYSHQSPRKMFRFINTRLNHVEYQNGSKYNIINEKCCFKQYDTEIIHDRKDLIKIRNKLQEEQVFFVYKKDGVGITGIQTLNKNYQLYSQYNETVNEFEKMFGLRWCAIDARKYPDLMGFINDGTHFNGTIDFIDTSQFKEIKPRNGYNFMEFKSKIPKNMRHIDMTKAYTQSDKCRWYDGFMLKITDFRKTNKYYDNGLYYIYDIDLNDCDNKFLQLNDQLDWFISENIYTSAELKALEELGGKFKVACGCWGIKDDFGFTKTMTEGVDEIVNPETGAVIKVPFYSKWAGMNCMQYENKNIWIQGDQLYLANFQTESDIYMSHYLNKDGDCIHEGRISYAKQKVMCKKHITAQITAYQRLTMLDQLLKMDFDKLVRVCVDGIYYWDHDYENKNDIMNKKDPLFGDKTKKMTFNNDPCTEYLSNLINKDGSSEAFGLDRAWECNAKPREHYKSELYDGAGGDGKTYGNIFIDEGFINVCYVPHSNKLATAMAEQYQKEKNEYLHTSNHYRVTNEPFAFMFKNGVGAEALKHSVYVIDEASFIKEGTKEFMLNRLWGKIVFCGDLKCQIEPSEGKQMTPKGIEHIAEMSGKNYRFKTKMQLNACNFLRDKIINKKSVNFSSLPYQTVNAEYVKNNYDHKKDMILVSCGASKNQKESNYNNWWNDYLDDTCVKYKVKNNTRDYKNGDIVFEKKGNGVVTEMRNGFTIHSIQGETYDGKIFIDMRRMRDLKMFYTAVSRARYESQIFLVKF